jgi:hypothetical protein
MDIESRLLQKREKVFSSMLRDTEMVQGTIVEREHTCGKDRCRCRQSASQLHRSYQLTFAIEGKTHTITIPKDKLSSVRKGLKQYRHFRLCGKQLLEINRALIKRHPSLPKSEERL